MCVHTEARGQHWVPFSTALYLNFLIQLFCWPWSSPLNKTGLRASWDITCICYLPDLWSEVSDTCHNAQLFSKILGIQTHFTFTHQVLYQLRYLSSSLIFFVCFFQPVLQLCSPDSPQTHLELLDLPASLSQSPCMMGMCHHAVLEMQVSALCMLGKYSTTLARVLTQRNILNQSLIVTR